MKSFERNSLGYKAFLFIEGVLVLTVAIKKMFTGAFFMMLLAVIFCLVAADPDNTTFNEFLHVLQSKDLLAIGIAGGVSNTVCFFMLKLSEALARKRHLNGSGSSSGSST